MVVRSDGKTFGPYTYRGEDAVFVFLRYLQGDEKDNARRHGKQKAAGHDEPRLAKIQGRWMNATFATKACIKTYISIRWRCMILIQRKYSGQSHRRCYHKAVNNRYVSYERRQPKDDNRSMDRKNPGRHVCFVQNRCLCPTSKTR